VPVSDSVVSASMADDGSSLSNQEIRHIIREEDVTTNEKESSPLDPLMDHLFYTRNPNLEPPSCHLPVPGPITNNHKVTPDALVDESIPPPRSDTRYIFPSRTSVTYPDPYPHPRLIDLPRSAIAQRILKEQAEAALHDSSIDVQAPPVIPETSTVDDGIGHGEESIEEEVDVVGDESTPNEEVGKLHRIIVSPQVISQGALLPIARPRTIIDQALLTHELGRLMPSLEEISVQPLNAHSCICDKTTVMVQRVHEFARAMVTRMGACAASTPFTNPDRLTAGILGLSWRAVKRAVEKPSPKPGPLPPCRTQHRPPVRAITKNSARGEIHVDVKIAIVKDYIVNRLTQSACASKYGVKLSYVQYAVKRFRQMGTLYGGDKDVDQDKLPREASGAIRESALIKRLNEMPNPSIMEQKNIDGESNEEGEDMNELDEWNEKKTVAKARRGRKRRGMSEEIDTSTVWSDIDEDTKSDYASKEKAEELDESNKVRR
ncbi:hypothetical protein PFISCL1PPCAC_2504, partial [Pristionchus fissidentatus]